MVITSRHSRFWTLWKIMLLFFWYNIQQTERCPIACKREMCKLSTSSIRNPQVRKKRFEKVRFFCWQFRGYWLYTNYYNSDTLKYFKNWLRSGTLLTWQITCQQHYLQWLGKTAVSVYKTLHQVYWQQTLLLNSTQQPDTLGRFYWCLCTYLGEFKPWRRALPKPHPC